ncbi:pentatricopeptide repeat-containing protein At3g03580-like [Phalaenopsis equestris]|uniref:pentatricopeptide repeat-containing protein At3g03580-like n=1 Tax=Phalaenopsis equestris TaxID=78828 RepID=UPI0009E61033|nr:pentatricopeptide repeat-containing protein At3g03580-like [Phalaenopsis equestris]XP_020585990.1 pentatricopeptide repeat-containing protein At3g03580-like [Phalaenopsis equestris]XP_020585991.1 pentatricopeptide repeat-containing protein At3g03580-like [Phalaenopsis equestris]XP_020585992.1 pentatricopeptide repeat-containing protein At3g03580-like [Phalaenopsis equestris]
MLLHHSVSTVAKHSAPSLSSLHQLILRSQSLSQTKQSHAHASISGLLYHNPSSMAALIISYSTFNDPISSLRLFRLNPLKPRSAFLWNSLVRALSRAGLNTQSFSVYNSMIQSSVSPDNRTFPFALSACSAAVSCDVRAEDKGKELHAGVVKLGFCSDVFVGNTLVAFYGACGDAGSACKVFDEMFDRDIISWNSLISVFFNNELYFDSMSWFCQLARLGLGVNSVSVVSVLPAAGAVQDGIFGAGIHGYAIKVGLDLNVTVGNALICMYGKCGELEDSVRAFESIMVKNDVSWNSIIGIIVHAGLSEDALEMFKEMLLYSGMEPNGITIASLLPLISFELLHLGREVHGYCVKHGMDSDVFVANSLLDMYAKCGFLKKGATIFNRISNKNVVSWNAMISNCTQNGDEMEAIRLVGEMQLSGEAPNAVTFTNVLPACARISSLNKGREIHARSIRDNCHIDLFVTNALLDMYVKCGRLNLARNLFDVSEKDEVSYNVLVQGYSQSDWCLKALNLFQEMRVRGMKYDTVSFMGALAACANLPALKQGKEVHCFILKKHIETDLFICNSILEMYNRCGRVDLGRKIFDRYPNKDVASWNSMIIGYGLQGDLATALDLFDRMGDGEVGYDHVSYVSALSICSHGGLVERGKRYFDRLLAQKMNLTQMHCACMVDLFGRAGLMDEAVSFIKEMPFEADFNVWGALLGACRLHGNIETGRWAAEHLFRLKPENSGYYVLLANMYAEAGRWDEADKIRKLMKSRSVKKNGGFSWIDSGKRQRALLMGELGEGGEDGLCTDSNCI